MCIELSFEPLTIEKWGDFVSLFGERGACGGCWCMLWRLSRKEFESQKGDTNKLAMKTIVAAGEVPGILVYHNSEAIGWCALAPRSRYPALLRSRILQPVDDQQCWSIACLFIKKPFRKKEYQQNFYSPQLYMPNRKVQNCWKVTQLNPKLSNKFLQLLPGLVFPKHSLVRDSGKLYDVHLLVL
tara:strand:+ start:202 stop:753 length:552 start_codon:yes stop_codon:yes gene_type:complete